MQLIEFDYSAVLKKHVIRTVGITLSGSGVTQHHAETVGPYNVYALTSKAFERVSLQYPNMQLMK